jgi:tripartite-type tricarboxylate transporter receptor subunit TctC
MKRIAIALASAALTVAAPAALGQAYPTKPVRIINPLAAGGNVDIVARGVAEQLSKALGQQVLVENRPGSSALIGTRYVKTQAPDGYTLLAIANTFARVPAIIADAGYDPIKDFTGVSQTCDIPMVLVVNPALPVKNVRELIALAKARPGKLNYASAGNGNATHLAGELFNMMAGVNTVHVPYKGGGHARTELLGGQVDFMFHNTTAVLGDVREKRLRALAVTGMKRAQAAPEVPTMDESALRGYEITSWFGVVAPAGTPQAAVTRLHGEFSKVMQIADVREKLAVLGSEAVGGKPADFAAHLRTEQEKWGKLIKQAGIRLD